MAKASDGDDILTLPEAQELLRERLPGRLRTVDADGLCLFHCLTSVSPEADVARMQEAAGCPAGVWGSEEHLDLLALTHNISGRLLALSAQPRKSA